MPVSSKSTKMDEKVSPSPPVDLAAVCPHAAKKLREAGLSDSSSQESNSLDVHKKTEASPDLSNCRSSSVSEEDDKEATKGNGEVNLRMEEQNAEEEIENDLYTLQLKLVLPGVSEPINVMVSSSDTVSDLKQYVFERQECCYRTCLFVRIDGKRVEDFLSLHLIPGLSNGSVVKFVEDVYSQREARLHICRLRDLLNGPQMRGLLNGNSTELSLSFLGAVMGDNPEVETGKLSQPSVEELHADSSLRVPAYCLPSAPPTLQPFYPENYFESWPECLKYLGYSQWNPPPNHRRMKGDLLYIDVLTLEKDWHCITASPSGFFLNRSQAHDAFDPTPQKGSPVNHNLASLLFHISPLFKKNFTTIQKQMKKHSPFEFVPLLRPGSQPWLLPRMEHTQEQVPVEGVLVSKLGLDEHIFGQLKDWNGEYQQANDLPQKTAADKISRQKNISRMFGEFLHAAVKGAVNVIEGNIAPVNPSDDKKNYIYLWNNIFFSLAYDTAPICYRKYGGDEAAHRACAADINGIAYFNLNGVEGVNTVETTVVDIKGNRVIAQAVVPGLLQSDPEAFVVYGQLDTASSTFKMDPQFTAVMRKAAESLHIREHKILGPKGEELVLPSSVEFKGMKGTDGRFYAMDLYKQFPEDANFLDPELNGEASTSSAEEQKKKKRNKEVGQNGEEQSDQKTVYPLRHRLMNVRSELLDKFIKNKYMTFVNKAIWHIKGSQEDSEIAAKETAPKETTGESPANDVTKERLDGNGESPPDDVMPDKDTRESPVVDPLQHMASDSATDQSESKMKEAIQQLKEVGGDVVDRIGGVAPTVESSAVSDAPKDVTSNPEEKGQMMEKVFEGLKKAAQDVGSSLTDGFQILFNVDYYTPEVQHADSEEQLKKDKKLLWELADFLGNKVVSIFIYDCAERVVTPWDGEMLTTVMHSRGINMRYLGGIARSIHLLKDKLPLDYLYNIVVMEMVLRCAKRFFRRELQRATFCSSGSVATHLLNCFLGKVEAQSETTKKKTKKKRKISQSRQEASSTTTESLWAAICKETANHFRYKMAFSSADDLCEQLSMSKISLLRGVCNKVGIQLFVKNFNLSEPTIFTEDDVAGIFPIAKHAFPRCIEGEALMEGAQDKLNSGDLQEAAALMMEALAIFNTVFGPVHELIGSCNRTLARIHFVAGQHTAALSFQQRATFVIERVNGVDHRTTIAAYIQLAMYCHECGQTGPALRLVYRARYLMKIIYGEGHPEVAVCDLNAAVMLHSIKHTKEAVVFLRNALEVNKKYLGEKSFQVGMNHHLLAQWLSSEEDFRGALTHEKAANATFESQLGSAHAQTRDSYECMLVLAGKAVAVQRRIKELTGALVPNSSDKIVEVSEDCQDNGIADGLAKTTKHDTEFT